MQTLAVQQNGTGYSRKFSIHLGNFGWYACNAHRVHSGNTMRQTLLSVALAVAALATGEVFAQGAIDAEIAPMGKLRYGLNASNAALSARAPDGSVSGISIDLGKFIAGRLGAPFEPVVYATTGDFTRSFDKGEWDITVVGASPGAKEKFSFTPDVLLVDYVYLAGPGRVFTDAADVDRPGIKVGASENGSGSQFLKRTLKFAGLVLGPGSVASEVELLGAGKVDVYGSNTNNLLLVAERLPGAAFVPGAFFTVHFAVAMPKARSPAAQERLTAIFKDATTTGLLQNAIQKAGLKGVRAPAN
jgi:polar amino acid transport system substrate-binding protein